MLQLSVLGPVEVRIGATTVAIRPPKQQALLGMLALGEGRALSFDELIEGLWGWDDSPGTAIGTIRNFVYSIRRQFAAHTGRTDIVGSVHGGYRLAAPIGIDARIAERHGDAAHIALGSGGVAVAAAEVRAGLDLWRGDPLIGVPGPWAAIERARLRRLHRALQESSIEVAVVAGEYDRALAEIESLRGADPHCERLAALMMTALHAAGRRAEALTVYQRTRRQLVRELGIEPGSALADLHRRILVDGAAGTRRGFLAEAPRRSASVA
ncbi:AfsR/SARP family transcriptional regulator [Nocardia crassostreae]|uniref:AfsR/SARP family transcriptional regulator n=1 Tax=Nocardia crassostreae TaxID=53428 RepID=UPI000A401F72|nr:AfsR/SARP family transcriptional regulator [Nocardia crassostreae]